jgi:hypothetical protein
MAWGENKLDPHGSSGARNRQPILASSVSYHLFSRHGSNEGYNQEITVAMAEIASFAPREYPHGSCRDAKKARSAVATVTSALSLLNHVLISISAMTRMNRITNILSI